MAEVYSMRRCMLLPISDRLDGALGFKVYQDLEDYLKESSWCYYKPNSEILNILANYKQNLEQHLSNPDVLKVVSRKVNAGSLIRIVLEKKPKGVQIDMNIIGDNGEDVYFKERMFQEGDDIELISQAIKNQLEVYEKQIPYDGKVLGVLGDQFTIDIGKQSQVRIGQDFRVFRPIRKKKHPLLKEVVEWEYEPIAKGKIFNVSEAQAQGVVRVYESRKKLKKGDWVRIDKTTPKKIIDDKAFPEIDKSEFGKLGSIGIDAVIGQGSSTSFDSSDTRVIDGLLLGLNLEGEVYATRNYWAGLSFGKRFGTYKTSEGTVTVGSNSVGVTTLKIVAGYKYLPLGFFYGPQVDGYIGYNKVTYNLDTSTSDSFGEANFSGLLAGIKANAPIIEKVRALIEFDFTLGTEYEEQVVIFGSADSASNLRFEAGAQYAYSPSIMLNATFEIRTSKAKFESPGREYSFKSTTLNLGAIFGF